MKTLKTFKKFVESANYDDADLDRKDWPGAPEIGEPIEDTEEVKTDSEEDDDNEPIEPPVNV